MASSPSQVPHAVVLTATDPISCIAVQRTAERRNKPASSPRRDTGWCVGSRRASRAAGRNIRPACQPLCLGASLRRAIPYIRRTISESRACPTWDEVAAARDLSLFVIRHLRESHMQFQTQMESCSLPISARAKLWRPRRSARCRLISLRAFRQERQEFGPTLFRVSPSPM